MRFRCAYSSVVIFPSSWSFASLATSSAAELAALEPALRRPKGGPGLSRPKDWTFPMLSEGEAARFTFDRNDYPNALAVALDSAERVWPRRRWLRVKRRALQAGIVIGWPWQRNGPTDRQIARAMKRLAHQLPRRTRTTPRQLAIRPACCADDPTTGPCRDGARSAALARVLPPCYPTSSDGAHGAGCLVIDEPTSPQVSGLSPPERA